MDPNIINKTGGTNHTSSSSNSSNNNLLSSHSSSKGHTTPTSTIVAPIKGLQVFIDSCLICNSQSYLCPKDNQNESSKQRTFELRSAFYSLFEIPVPESFIRNNIDEIPLCSGCTYKLGRLKMLYEQLEAIQKEFGKMKEEIAFSIVDIVAASEDTEGWGPVDFKSLPSLTLQRYLRQAEVDTLQRFVFDEWHDKPSSEDYCPSPPPLPALIAVGQNGPSPGGLPRLKSPILHSMNRNPGVPGVSNKVNLPVRNEPRTTQQQQQQKTTDISITTPETRLKKVNNGNHLSEMGKRKAEVPTTGISNVTKKLKSIPGMNEVGAVAGDLKGGEQQSLVKRRSEGERGSPPIKHDDEDDESSPSSRLEICLDEGDDQIEEYDPTDVEITKVDNGDSRESNESPENGRPAVLGADINRENSNSPGKMTEEIDFYEGMSLSELASFVTEEDPDLTEEGQEGTDEETDPERQKYLENIIIAQLQAGGGSNIEFQQNEEGLYVCMFCNKTFIHKYPYRDHLKTHTGEGPRCPVCNKIFPKTHNLMLHLRTHTGEKPFQCDVCHKGFAGKSNLKVHYRMHTGEKPYKCDFCNLAFVNSSGLVIHRRLHTGERPFACEYCGKSFATPNQLQSHEKVHKTAGTSSD